MTNSTTEPYASKETLSTTKDQLSLGTIGRLEQSFRQMLSDGRTHHQLRTCVVDDRLRFVHAPFKQRRNYHLCYLVLAPECFYEVHQVSDGALHVFYHDALHFSAGVVVFNVVNLGNTGKRSH